MAILHEIRERTTNVSVIPQRQLAQVKEDLRKNRRKERTHVHVHDVNWHKTEMEGTERSGPGCAGEAGTFSSTNGYLVVRWTHNFFRKEDLQSTSRLHHVSSAGDNTKLEIDCDVLAVAS